MLRCMTLADLGTSIANIRAHATHLFGPRTGATDPFRCQETHLSTFTTEANALRHEVMVSMLSVIMHPDHVIGAGFAHARAGETRLNTIILLLIQYGSRLHEPPLYLCKAL